jgi:UPF0755 protein
MPDRLDITRKNFKKYLTSRKRIFYALTISILAVIAIFYSTVLRAPTDFPVRSMIHIEEGSTHTEIASQLEFGGVVRSALWLRFFSTLFNGDGGILAGDYFFERPQNIVHIARSITSGNFGMEPIAITIPEGTTVVEMGAMLKDRINTFDAEKFIQYGEKEEGYLFPDTYLFLPNVKARDVVNTMRETFDERIESITKQITEFGAPFEEVITMASIVEAEARQLRSRRIVAGVLWKRIDIGMPLQVDATFVRVNGKNSFTLTLEDLEEDHPYNTYTNTGLPPGPIGNPGLDSILAAVTPIDSNYLYFLTGHDGFMHYAETFEGHLRNKRLYLN